MPKDKDFKRLVRARMEKTGESYTAARAQLLKQSPALDLPDDYLDLAGMGDDAVQTKTGQDWPGWVRALDAAGAAAMPHRDIARHLKDEHGLSSWWSQTVTVAYERIRGLRKVGQRRGGRWEANKTRTVPVPVADLRRAFTDDAEREKWLPDVELEIRDVDDRRALCTFPDGTPVDFSFIDKGEKKSALTIQHRKLPDADAREERKAYWGRRLDALKALLSQPSST